MIRGGRPVKGFPYGRCARRACGPRGVAPVPRTTPQARWRIGIDSRATALDPRVPQSGERPLLARGGRAPPAAATASRPLAALAGALATAGAAARLRLARLHPAPHPLR